MSKRPPTPPQPDALAAGAFADILVSICRCFGVFERDTVCCGDVTISQCVALQRLLESARDVSTLAELLGVTVSASTRLIDGLGRRGWVERQRDPVDRRRVMVVLSEEGVAQAQRLCAQSASMLEQIFARIPEPERAQVLASLRLVQRALDECRAEGCGDPSSGSCC